MDTDQGKDSLSSRKRPLHIPAMVNDETTIPMQHRDEEESATYNVALSSFSTTATATTTTASSVVSSVVTGCGSTTARVTGDASAGTTMILPAATYLTAAAAAAAPTTEGTNNATINNSSNDLLFSLEAGEQESELLPIAGGDDNDNRTSKDYYFDSYSHHAIHEEMLKDEVRTRAFQMAILHNRHLFQNKIVLDVGCGTAILSMFAAQAGAKHVYGVDCSTIIDQAQQIVERNGFSDRVTLIKGKMEEIDLPVSTVDVIISEWMGYFLLYESMLDTVIYARDKWLVPNGVLFPDKAIMYICGAEDAHVKTDRIDFWDNVYGFDMTPLKEIALKEPVVDVIDSRQIVTDTVPILRLDILTCTKEDLLFRSHFTIRAQRNDSVHALVAYFECAFTQGHKPIGFSTSPFARYTHWKQTLLYLREPVTVSEGETLTGEISCRPNMHNRRDLDIGLVLHLQGYYGHVEEARIQMNYRLR